MTEAGPDDGDETLATRARAGDRFAFEALMRRHQDGVYRFARRSTGDADDAYDVVQATFIAAWRGLRRYDPARPFAPWLHMIALNKCRDHGRRQAVRRLFLRAYGNEPGPPPDPDDAVERRAEARLRALDQAIGRLPTRYREPLLLTTAGGLSHQDAAAVLQTSAKAIEMRLYRARQLLKAMLCEG